MMRRIANVLGAALFAVSITQPAYAGDRSGQAPLADKEFSARAVTSGACAGLTVTNYKADSAVDASTASSSYVGVPNSGIGFNQGSMGCVIVTFSAESYAEFGRLMLLRARLDDSITAAPGPIQFSGDDDEDGDGRWARSRAFTFIFPSVPAGVHLVRIEFRSITSGRRVYIGRHTTVLQHR